MRTVIGLPNMHKTIVIVIWLVLVIPSAARAQGSWLQKGVSGVGAEASASHQDGSNTFGVRGGYSYQGIFDAVLDAAWVDTTVASVPDLSVYGLGLSLAYHPVKQTREFPVSLSVGAGYARTFYSSAMLRDNEESVSQWATALVGGAYRFFPLGGRIGAIPEIDLSWIHTSFTDEVPGDARTTTDDLFEIRLKAALAYLDSAGHIWGVAPSLSFGPGNTPTMLGISITFISTLPGAR